MRIDDDVNESTNDRKCCEGLKDGLAKAASQLWVCKAGMCEVQDE